MIKQQRLSDQLATEMGGVIGVLAYVDLKCHLRTIGRNLELLRNEVTEIKEICNISRSEKLKVCANQNSDLIDKLSRKTDKKW